MEKHLNYLNLDFHKNSYIIRAISNKITGFRIIETYDSENNTESLIALWEDEKIATIRGAGKPVVDWFEAHLSDYSFVDLEEPFFEEIRDKWSDETHVLSAYILMDYLNVKQAKDTEEVAIAQMDKKMWESTAKIYYKNYGKSLSPFQGNNQVWYVIQGAEYPLSIVCYDRVDSDRYVLSNMYTIPEYRKAGLAKKLITNSISKLNPEKLVLFVEEDNGVAISLYEKLGFVRAEKMINIELK